jgi:uncharacterized DUF497 family protein
VVWVRRLDWDQASIDHIARHGVEPDEVEDVVFGQSHQNRARDGRYRFVGQTSGGRYLAVFVEPESESGVFYVLTARDATIQERRLIRRR